MTDPGSRRAATEPARADRHLSDLTWTALILAGVGLPLALMSGVGMPVAAAGAVCGLFALRRRPADRPWPAVAVATGGVGAVIGLVLLIVSAVVWLPELPGLLVG